MIKPKVHTSVISIDIYEIDEEDAADDVGLLLDGVEHGLSEEQANFIAFQISNVLQERAHAREMETKEKMNAMLTNTQKACQDIYEAGIESEDNGYEL